jgi:hypothetical protein
VSAGHCEHDLALAVCSGYALYDCTLCGHRNVTKVRVF